jgi:hypothetical protein
VHHRHKDDQRCRGHQEGDQPLFQVIKDFHNWNSEDAQTCKKLLCHQERGAAIQVPRALPR